MILALFAGIVLLIVAFLYTGMINEWSKWLAGLILLLFFLVSAYVYTEEYEQQRQIEFVCDRAHGVLLKTVNGETICADRDTVHVLGRDQMHYDERRYNG